MEKDIIPRARVLAVLKEAFRFYNQGVQENAKGEERDILAVLQRATTSYAQVEAAMQMAFPQPEKSAAYENASKLKDQAYQLRKDAVVNISALLQKHNSIEKEQEINDLKLRISELEKENAVLAQGKAEIEAINHEILIQSQKNTPCKSLKDESDNNAQLDEADTSDNKHDGGDDVENFINSLQSERPSQLANDISFLGTKDGNSSDPKKQSQLKESLVKDQAELYREVIQDMKSGEFKKHGHLVLEISKAIQSSLRLYTEDLFSSLESVSEDTIQELEEAEKGQSKGGDSYFDLMKRALGYTFSKVWGTIQYLSVGAFKLLVYVAKWLKDNGLQIAKWLANNPKVVMLALSCAKILKRRLCNWLSMKFGYTRYILHTKYGQLKGGIAGQTGLMTELAMEYMKNNLSEMLTTFISTSWESISGLVGPSISTSISGVLVIYLGPFAGAVAAGLMTLGGIMSSIFTESFKGSLQFALYGGQLQKTVQLMGEIMDFSECLQLQDVTVGDQASGADISTAEYTAHVMNNKDLLRQLLGNEAQHLHNTSSGLGYYTNALGIHNIARDTILPSDIGLTPLDLEDKYKVRWLELRSFGTDNTEFKQFDALLAKHNPSLRERLYKDIEGNQFIKE